MLWPDGTLEITRSPWRARGRVRYFALPSARTPIWLLPADRPEAAAALRRHDEGQRANRRWELLASAHRHGLLDLLPIPRVVVPAERSPILERVGKYAPDATAIAIRFGRPREGRATVIQAIDQNGSTLAFVKVATGRGIDRLAHEREVLDYLQDDAIPGLRTPRAIAYEADHAVGILVTSPLTTAGTAVRRDDAPVDLMHRVADPRPPVPLASTAAMARLGVEIGHLRASAEGPWLDQALHALLRSAGTVPVPGGAAHGDWAPWNMAYAGDELQLWDWDGYEPASLAGFDHLHYLAQLRRTTGGTRPADEDAWLAESRAALGTHWDLEGESAEAVIRAYLIDVNARYARERIEDRAHPLRVGWARSLVTRLGEEGRSG